MVSKSVDEQSSFIYNRKELNCDYFNESLFESSQSYVNDWLCHICRQKSQARSRFSTK